jgi:spore maturation protein SpmA
MYLASADYPNSDISTGEMLTIAVVMASVLLIWLGSVYLAERSGQARARRARNSRPVLTPQGNAADDDHSGAGDDGEAGRQASAA